MELTFNDTFAPNYSGKLFTVKPAQVSYTLRNDVDAMTPEGKTLQDMMKKAWATKMGDFKKQKEKEYADAIKATEESLLKKAAAQKGKIKDVKKWLEEEVKGANVMIANAMKTLEGLVESTAQAIYEKVADAIDKKYKSEIKKMKIKAGLKIAAHVLIIVAAAAIAIVGAAAGLAATVASGGAGAVSFAAVVPVVLASLKVIATSGAAIYGEYSKAWPSHKKAVANLEKVLKDLQTAIDYEQKKQLKKDTTGKLGPKEKLKLLMNNVKGKRDDVVKAVKAAETWAGHLRQQIEKMAVDITKMQEPIDKMMASKDPKATAEAAALVKQQANLIAKLDSARGYLQTYDKLLAETSGVLDKDLTNPALLKGLIGKVQAVANNDTLQLVISNAKPVITGVQKTMEALSKVH